MVLKCLQWRCRCNILQGTVLDVWSGSWEGWATDDRMVGVNGMDLHDSRNRRRKQQDQGAPPRSTLNVTSAFLSWMCSGNAQPVEADKRIRDGYDVGFILAEHQRWELTAVAITGNTEGSPRYRCHRSVKRSSWRWLESEVCFLLHNVSTMSDKAGKVN